MKVLVVDDATFMRGSLRLILERNGFDVVGEAENGKIAVELYSLYKPDVVTMDITMPVMDGISALKKILEIDSAAKIVMISAMGQQEVVRDAVLGGAKGFIVKPFTEEVVTKALRKLGGQ